MSIRVSFALAILSLITLGCGPGKNGPEAVASVPELLASNAPAAAATKPTPTPSPCTTLIPRDAEIRATLKGKGDYYSLVLPTKIQSGKRIVHLFMEETCREYDDTNFFGDTDETFSVGTGYDAAVLYRGTNTVNFEIEECTEMDLSGPKPTCRGTERKDRGTFIVESL